MSVQGGHPPSRVLAMSPALTEILFALGKGDAVVGVTDFSTYPPATLRLPKVGGFLNPNLERIVALRPDLVFLVPDQKILKQQLEALRIPTRTVSLYGFEDIPRAMATVGEALGIAEQGRAMAEKLRKDVAAIRSQAGPNRPRVLVVVGRNFGSLSNIYAAGPGTFLGQLVELAGGRNAYTGNVLYPNLSIEGIASIDPDVILELCPDIRPDEAGKKRMVAEWGRIPARRAFPRRVWILPQDYVSLPGPRVVETLRLFRTCIGGR